MSRKSLFGKVTKTHDKPRKRPGRHKKRLNKHEKRQQKKRKKGKKRYLTIILVYPIYTLERKI